MRVTNLLDEVHAIRDAAVSTKCCAKKPFGCGEPVEGFRDALSKREYAISGLCQRCQDAVFGAE